MAYRNPRFAYLHAARDAGAAAITLATGTFETDGQKEFLSDGQFTLARITHSGSVVELDVDRGAAGLEAIDRLVIPVGHNLDTIVWNVESGSSFPPTTSRGAGTFSGAGIIDESLTSSTDRYWRLNLVGSVTHEIPQLLFTATVTTSIRGPEPPWIDRVLDGAIRNEKQSGARAILQPAPSRRLFEYSYRAVKNADRTTLRALIAAVGRHQPFILDPAFDDEGPVWVELIDDPDTSYDFPAPSLGTKGQRFRFRMLEVVA